MKEDQFILNTRKKPFLQRGWWNTGMGCPERWWIPHPRKHPRSGWFGHYKTWSSWRCPFRGPFQPKLFHHLWFYDWPCYILFHLAVFVFINVTTEALCFYIALVSQFDNIFHAIKCNSFPWYDNAHILTAFYGMSKLTSMPCWNG